MRWGLFVLLLVNLLGFFCCFAVVFVKNCFAVFCCFKKFFWFCCCVSEFVGLFANVLLLFSDLLFVFFWPVCVLNVQVTV